MSGILSAFIGRVAGVVTDAYFNLVTLLLPGNGTNGAQNNTFLDSSSNNFTITRNGNTTQGTFSPFSQTGWSNNFVRASSQYLTVSNSSGDFSFGTGAFTIECWVNPSSLPSGTGYPNSYWIFGGGPFNSDSGIDFYINNTQIGFNLTSFSSATAIGNHGMSVGNWYHVAVVRGGGSNQTVSIYVNGTRVATASSVTATADAASTGISISAAEPSGATSGNFDGYISNYRVVKGTAVYDPTESTLTVPTASLTAITNTVLLTCQSNRFIDTNTQVTAKTITVNGSPSVQAFSPFAPTAAYSAATVGGSGYFDGTGDYLTLPVNSAFDLGTNACCVEAWVYPLNTSAIGLFCTTSGASGQTRPNFYITTTSFQADYFGSAFFSGSATIPLNSWNHVVFTRASTNGAWRFFLNGVLTGYNATGTQNLLQTTVAQAVGLNSGTSANAYMLGVRVINGSVPTSYETSSTTTGTSIFTPPTAPLTTTSQGATSGDVKLLLNFTNAGITDATAKNDLETVGNAQISTTQSKFGGSSMYFDGTGDWLTVIDNPNLQMGSGDFTIEGWFYLSATGVAYGIVSKGTSTTGWSVNVTSGNKLQFSYTSSNLTGATTLSSATWYYFAVVRSGTATGNLKIYLNGSADATSAGAVTDNFNQTSIMYVGADRVGTSALNGYIDDLRITKGFARTIATPSSAFALQ